MIGPLCPGKSRFTTRRCATAPRARACPSPWRTRAGSPTAFTPAKLPAVGSTRRPGVRPQEDSNIQALVEAGPPVVTIFGKSWDLHVTHALGTTLEENVAMIGDSVAYLLKHFEEVIYDAEHFFDGFKKNREYALATLKAAEAAGAPFL